MQCYFRSLKLRFWLFYFSLSNLETMHRHLLSPWPHRFICTGMLAPLAIEGLVGVGVTASFIQFRRTYSIPFVWWAIWPGILPPHEISESPVPIHLFTVHSDHLGCHTSYAPNAYLRHQRLQLKDRSQWVCTSIHIQSLLLLLCNFVPYPPANSVIHLLLCGSLRNSVLTSVAGLFILDDWPV